MPEETVQATINSINVNSTDYPIEDTVARSRAAAAQATADEAKAAAEGIMSTTPAWVSHRNTYRGKFLGTSYTDEQKAMISAGTFDDLYIGDYWTINGHDWLIADINYWLGTGDTPCTTNHLVIVPRNTLGAGKMKSTANTSGGYLQNELNLSQYYDIASSSFGAENILSHREIFTNASTNGVPSSIVWGDSGLMIMNENIVYGSKVVSSMSTGTIVSDNGATIDKTQLSLFRLRPENIGIGTTYWLRDIADNTDFCMVGKSGLSSHDAANKTYGIRTVFGLTGGN